MLYVWEMLDGVNILSLFSRLRVGGLTIFSK
jgi:hypothetical protein